MDLSNAIAIAVETAGRERLPELTAGGNAITQELQRFLDSAEEEGGVERLTLVTDGDADVMFEKCGGYLYFTLVADGENVWGQSRLQIMEARLDNGAGFTGPLVIDASIIFLKRAAEVRKITFLPVGPIGHNLLSVTRDEKGRFTISLSHPIQIP